MSEKKTHEYSNGEVTVVWEPELCIHAGECVKGSPSVFRPKDKPWIQIKGSSSGEIIKTVDKCPSGALTYRKDDDAQLAQESPTIRIKASKNGPLLVPGNVEIEDRDGNIRACEGKVTALCRCGASSIKPFCDGSHTNVKFFG